MSCKILWLLHFTFGSALKANHVVMVLIFFRNLHNSILTCEMQSAMQAFEAV